MRTIYPPVAQAAFTLAHWLHPWSLVGWRLTLFLFDITVLCILLAILQTLGLPLLWLVIYWWNPVLVKETFNSGHMDVIVLPFILGAVLLAIRGRHLWGTVSSALAIGAKVWPLMLLPLILRPLLTAPKRLIVALCLFGLLAGAMAIPIYAAGLDNSSGFTAYGQRWEMNDALFMIFVWGARLFFRGFGVQSGNEQLVARIIVFLLLSGWIAWLARSSAQDGRDFCERCLLIVGGVFLLSPTQFPWYYIWIIPFLAIRPRLSLLLLTILLPLYYLRFYFSARDSVNIFDYGIVWLEFVPVWCLLVWEWRARRRYNFADSLSEVSA